MGEQQWLVLGRNVILQDGWPVNCVAGTLMWASHFPILGLSFFFYKMARLYKMTFLALSSFEALLHHPGLGHVLEDVLWDTVQILVTGH